MTIISDRQDEASVTAGARGIRCQVKSYSVVLLYRSSKAQHSMDVRIVTILLTAEQRVRAKHKHALRRWDIS